MGKNLVREVFSYDGTWTAPGGVTQVRVTAVAHLPAAISCGDAVQYGIATTGTIWTTGNGNGGALGNGIPPSGPPYSVSVPQITAGGYQWQQVSSSVGAGHALALLPNGTGYAFGVNTSGQLGDGTNTPRSLPTAISGSTVWRTLVAGGSNGYGIAANGDGYAWGNGIGGTMGDGTSIGKSVPTAIAGGKKWLSLAAGNSNIGGIDSVNGAWGWGENTKGQLGDGTATNRSSPVSVSGSLKFAMLAKSAENTYGITTNGDLYAWGANNNGQLGDGTIVAKSTPTLVLGSRKWRYIAAGGYYGLGFAMGIDRAGQVYAWGLNGDGQCSTGVSGNAYSTPTAIPSAATYSAVACGSAFSLLLGPGGIVGVSGNNAVGQLGTGDVNPRSNPVATTGNQRYQTVQQQLVNQRVLDVTPGNSYPIALFTDIPAFGGVPLFQNQYATANAQIRFILEYEA